MFFNLFGAAKLVANRRARSTQTLGARALCIDETGEIMSGGINAAIVPCMKCLGRAVRVYEGMENDGYECNECGHKFSIDWSHGGPPVKPCWPLSEEEENEARRIIELINKRG